MHQHYDDLALIWCIPPTISTTTFHDDVGTPLIPGDLSSQAHVAGQHFDWMNRALLWKKHIKNKQSRKYTTHIKHTHTDKMQEFEPIYVIPLLLYDANYSSIIYYNSVHVYIEC